MSSWDLNPFLGRYRYLFDKNREHRSSRGGVSLLTKNKLQCFGFFFPRELDLAFGGFYNYFIWLCACNSGDIVRKYRNPAWLPIWNPPLVSVRSKVGKSWIESLRYTPCGRKTDWFYYSRSVECNNLCFGCSIVWRQTLHIFCSSYKEPCCEHPSCIHTRGSETLSIRPDRHCT